MSQTNTLFRITKPLVMSVEQLLQRAIPVPVPSPWELEKEVAICLGELQDAQDEIFFYQMLPCGRVRIIPVSGLPLTNGCQWDSEEGEWVA